VRIRDNGCGIDSRVLRKVRDGHWGLATMRERAATIGGLLEIASSTTTGTEVKLFIPFNLNLEYSLPNTARLHRDLVNVKWQMGQSANVTEQDIQNRAAGMGPK
jgi:hypothetical protein